MSFRSNFLLPILSAAFILSTTPPSHSRMVIPSVDQDVGEYINAYKSTHPNTPYPLYTSPDFEDFCLPLHLLKNPGNQSPYNVAYYMGKMTVAYLHVLAHMAKNAPAQHIDQMGTSYFSCLAATGDALVRLVVTEELDHNMISSFDNDNLATWDQVMKTIPIEKASALVKKWAYIQKNWGK